MTELAGAKPLITIVTPIHNEADNLERYRQRVSEALLSHSHYRFQVLLIDDGSSDDSWARIRDICGQDARFRGLRLSRNFGAHVALTAGLHQASGDAVVLLACDLQDPPETVVEFLEKWRSGAQIVWGRRSTRADSGWRIVLSKFFEKLIRRYAMPTGSLFATGSFLLMDKKVLQCFLQFQESNRVTFALVAWCGFEQAVVAYDRQPRLAGKSSWKLKNLIKAAYDTFLAFSKVPFGTLTVLGALMFFLSIPCSLYLLFSYLLGNPQPGWTSIMLVMIMFFGLQFLFMSLQGEYLSRIFSETVRRPLYFISAETPQTQAPNQEEPSREAA